MISNEYEIRKQVLGRVPDLEKNGRTLNRVHEWDRDGITNEADQRHVREIVKGLELERANHRRTDADEGRPSTDDDVTKTDPGWPMTMPMTARHSQVVSQDRPDLKFALIRVCCSVAKPSMREMECVKRIGRYLVGKPRAKCWFRWQQSGNLEAYSDADWGGDRTVGLSWSHIEGMPLSQSVDQEAAAESDVVRRERAVCCGQDSVGKGSDPKRGEGPGNIMQTESVPGCFGNDVPGQSQGTGQGEAC